MGSSGGRPQGAGSEDKTQDWTCAECGNTNYGRRHTCNRCALYEVGCGRAPPPPPPQGMRCTFACAELLLLHVVLQMQDAAQQCTWGQHRWQHCWGR